MQWGASVDATGKIQVNSTGQLEMMAENLNIVGKCNVKENYPFTRKQKQSYDHYRQYLHFRYQIEYFTSLLRFRHASTLKVHDYFTKHGFVGIHTPIITGNDCEGAGEIFRVQPNSDKLNEAMRKDKVSSKNAFFDSPAYLTVSGQLHLEAVARYVKNFDRNRKTLYSNFIKFFSVL